MNFFKTLSLAAVLFCPAVALPSLHAQTSTASGGTITLWSPVYTGGTLSVGGSSYGSSSGGIYTSPQTPTGSSVVLGNGTWTLINGSNVLLIGGAASSRSYSGTVTQTTAAGQTTLGTFTLSMDGNGKLAATITLGGTSTVYAGALGRKSDGEHKRSGSGYLVRLDSTAQRMAGVEKIPLIVKKSVVQGGTLDANGNSLVFRGSSN